MEVRRSEHRIQAAMATSLFWRHQPDRSAFIIHEGHGGEHPDLVLLTPTGNLHVYELKRDKLSEKAAAKAICQGILYAESYRAKTENELAGFYASYMRELDRAIFSREQAEDRYRDPPHVFKRDLREFFGSNTPVTVGGKVESVVILSLDWSAEAINLARTIADQGLAAAAPVLERHAGPAQKPAKRVRDVLSGMERLEPFAKGCLQPLKFINPIDWIVPA